MNSPEYIQTSLAAAMSLGFEPGSFKYPVRLTGLNLLLTYDSGCLGKCAYCGIAGVRQNAENSRSINGMLNNKIIEPAGGGTDAGIISGDDLNGRRSKAKKTFIRVKWPVYRLDDVLDALKAKESSFERICLSMVTHADAIKDTIEISKKIKHFSSLPLSLLITPSLIGSPEILRQFKAAGAEMVGIAVDTSTKDLFEKYRGKGVEGPHKWQKYWEVLKWAVDIFGRFNAGIHLIAGLGETEEQAVKIIYDAHLMGAKTHLFSFYPEPESLLEDHERPELVSYRKIQIARYLINEKGLDISKIHFDRSGSGNVRGNNSSNGSGNGNSNSSGNDSRNDSSGNDSRNDSSGNDSRNDSSGKNSIGSYCNSHNNIGVKSSGNGSSNGSVNVRGNNSSNGSGRILSFDYDLREVLEEGFAFMTSGCPCSSDSRISACNRPFANERPSELFRNYPYLPDEKDRETIKSQISELLSTVLR